MVLTVKIDRKNVSAWLQYLYFLRFPIIGWLTLPLLCLLDARTGADTITRGIMTLSRMWQAFYVGFFVPGLGMTVYICTRNIVRNGNQRFDAPPPERWWCWFGEPNNRRIGWSLAIAHVPTVSTLAYVAYNTMREGEIVYFGIAYWRLWSGYALGLLLATVFWYLVSFFYIWLHPVFSDEIEVRTDEGGSTSLTADFVTSLNSVSTPSCSASVAPITADHVQQESLAGQVSVSESSGEKDKRCKTLPLMPTPCRWILWAQDAAQPNYAVIAEKLTSYLLRFTCRGYAEDTQAPIWPMHLLSIVGFTAFLMLYFFLYPLTAPVYFSSGWVTGILAVLVFAGCVYGARTENGMQPIGLMFTLVKGSMLTILLILLYVDFRTKEVRLETAFPVLASLMVISIFFQWFISGVSFFLDRYRIPVLTAVIFIIFLPKQLPIDQDHYFDVLETERVTTLDSPSQAIEDRAPDTAEPYIIVSATGGGIRAAEWTAQVMAELERSFHDDPTLQQNSYQFHSHLLLASGVSGGSVGLMPYLLEYTAAHPFAGDPDFTKRLTEAPRCSSLEAVAWGLEYYDLQRLLLTWRPAWLQSKHAPDRTWALTQAFNRNLRADDLGCSTNKLSWPQGMLNGQQLTLKGAADRLHSGSMPAFTFNTTVAETGGRFLLSNYRVPPMPPDVIGKTDFLPAESFLQAYGQESRCDAAQVRKDCFLDVELATAARLSATFPVVSSATRIPRQYAITASHFLDGGYFDNDGTSSVIEFIYSALEERERNKFLIRTGEQKEFEAWSEVHAPARPLQRLRILLVEIRDGDDMNPTQNIDDWNHQIGADLETGSGQPKPWNVASQMFSPLEGLWNAGHVSVTRRNRRELCILERAYLGRSQDNLEIHHIVLGIPPEPQPNKPGQFRTPPLNWKLTTKQATYLHEWAITSGKPTQTMIAGAVKWVGERLPRQLPGHAGVSLDAGYPPCEIDDQTYMRRDDSAGSR